jgi:type I restriction enzyme S subunit
MKDVKLVPLDKTTIQLIDGDRGNNYPNKKDFSEEGHCLFLDSSNLTKNGFDFSSKVFINKYKDQTMGKGHLQRRDIVINTRGTIGNIGYYKDNVPYNNIRINSGMLIIRGGADYDNGYLYCFLRSKLFFSQVDNIMSGSVQNQLPIWILNSLKLPEIDIPNQQKIAFAISTIDSKVELNNYINVELEAMAKMIFDYWFVQFDFPNNKGKPYKTNRGKMVWNKELKREIPEGWEVKKLVEIENNIITGKTPPTNNEDFFNGNIPFITIGDIRGNMHIIKTEINLTNSGADYQKNKYLPKGSLCVSCIASPGLIGFTTRDSQTNQQINSIIFQNNENKLYLYFALNDYFKFANGAKTGNTFANMNKGDFESIHLIYPPKEILINFEKIMASSAEKIFNLLNENQQLSELRDWLLPMLMNGQITVN